ncbi:MAG: hypothetical protein ACYTDY_08175 [Planctomycetota bacterium]
MMRAIAILIVLALLTGAVALAEESKGKGKPAAAEGGEKKEKKDKKSEKTQTPLQKLLKELKALVAREKAKPKHDKGIVKDILDLVKSFEKKKEEPVKLEDLSEADRKRLEAEVRKKMEDENKDAAARGGGDRGGPGDWWSRRLKEAVAKALDEVKLTDEQRKKCEEILNDFAPEFYQAQRNSDFKLAKDLKTDAEKRLKKVVGAKKARDIMNNINRMLPNRRGGWGGGGR